MVRHSYSYPLYIKYYFSLSINLWMEVKNNVRMTHKNWHLCFFLSQYLSHFSCTNPLSHPDIPIIIPFREKLIALDPPCGGHYRDWDRQILLFWSENRGFEIRMEDSNIWLNQRSMWIIRENVTYIYEFFQPQMRKHN